MTEYVSSVLSRPQNGSSSFTLDNKLLKYADILNRITIKNCDLNTNVKNKKVNSMNMSSSLLPNNSLKKK